MTWFIVVAVALTLATVAALLWPLLRRGEADPMGSSSELSVRVLREQLADLDAERASGTLDATVYAQEKLDLERRALDDAQPQIALGGVALRKSRLAVAIGVLVPALAAGLYWGFGEPDALQPGKHAAADDAHAVSPQQIQEMVARLAERLQSNPNDGEGWLMLARSYSVMGRYAESAAAFARAAAMLPPNANLLADYADVLAMAQGRKLAGEPEKAIVQALAIDPNHVKALALSGSVAFEREDYARAVSEWRKILSQLPPDSPVAANIGRSIADAESRIAGGQPVRSPASSAPTAAPTTKTAAAAARVAGKISIAPNLLAQLPAAATIYVFARDGNGGRVPLAMRRIDGAKFPLEFSLDQSMAMMPNMTLADAKEVVVGARVSRDGDAIGKVGDLEGYSQPVAIGRADVAVVIDSVRK